MKLKLTKEQTSIYNRNRKLAIQHFEETGELPKDRDKWEYIIHHKDPSWKHNDIDRYIAMNFEDLEVKKTATHSSEHNKGRKWSEESKQRFSETKKGCTSPRKGCVVSEESRRKMSEAAKKSYANGKVIWNKGLTKETDIRVASYGEKESLTKRLVKEK